MKCYTQIAGIGLKRSLGFCLGALNHTSNHTPLSDFDLDRADKTFHFVQLCVERFAMHRAVNFAPSGNGRENKEKSE